MIHSQQTVENLPMSMDRKRVKKIRMGEEEDDGYVQADKKRLFSMMWELTKDSWAFVRGNDAEQRLQRDVTAVVRRTC